MKYIGKFLFLFLLMHNTTGFSQSFYIDWQACFGGSEWDQPKDMIQVSDGYLIVGNTYSSDGDVSSNNGESDIWLVKIDFTGNVLFEKTYGGTLGEGPYGIFTSSDGNYYILGVAYSSDGDISFDPYPTSNDFWIIKIDGEGNIIWDKIVGGNGYDQPYRGYATTDGGIVAAGWTNSSDGDVSHYYGSYDMWMVKLSSDGEIEGDFTAGSSGMENAQAIIQTSDGSYLIGGNSFIGEGGNLTCEPHSSWAAEAVLIRLDTELNIEWQDCYGGTNHETILELLEIDNGYVFLAGTMSNDGDVSGSGWHGENDNWVVNLNFDGNIVWQKCYGGSKSEGSTNIIGSNNGSFIVVGNTYSHDGDVSNNHSQSEYESEIWAFGINDTGELLWERCFGGYGDDYIQNGVVIKNKLNFVIAGYTDYGPSYDVGCTPHGGNWNDRDFWVFEVKDTTVSLQEQPAQVSALTTYPNPAKNYVCFERKGKTNNHRMEINIFSASGLPVKELTLYPGETLKVWDTRSIPAGVYFYRYQEQDGASAYGKVVIK